ncbi:MAG TPA: chaperonin GroEL [Candidatus Paceibacterota bacterium]|nr:chaperonin GroEL [Candidatus Paceibacterota bacterium]
MSKKIVQGTEAQALLKRGIDAVANAVKITLGPRGRNVVFDKGYGVPTVTNDGVSIAKEITLANKFENMGAEIVKEVASKTNDAAGDGTTTSVVLTQAIITEGLKRTGMGANGIVVRQGIEAAAADVVAALKVMAKPIKNKEEIAAVATISAESEEIGGIIAETIEKVGKDGVVTVEESQAFGVDSELVEGMEFDKGYISHYMITNQERMEASYSNVPVLVTDKKISAVKDILPLLEKLAQTGKKEIVIIADDVDGEALATFLVNKIRGIFNILAIKAPGYGDRKKEQLADIAVVLGAKVISEDIGQTLESAELAMLGRASKVIATKDKTTIVDGKGKKEEIKARVQTLKAQLQNTTMKYDREHLEKRIAKLASGVAVIKVGAATETEMKYLKLKIEDAVNATKAAIEEGIVPGGGVALAKVAQKIEKKMKASAQYKKSHESKRESEFVIGYLALVSALTAPLRNIAFNAGHEDPALIVAMVQEAAGEHMGYDASADSLEGTVVAVDLMKKGIIDPVKVTRTALQNAASAAGILLTTDVAIADEPEKEKAIQDGAPDMGY